MQDIERLLNNVSKLDLNDILFAMWKRNDTQDYIIELNTEEQLYDEGIRSDGTELGDYTPYTKQKKSTGNGDKRIDHITLKDTGEFYKSFRVKPSKKGFKITANPNKDDNNLFDDFGTEIVGLTKESVFKLLDFIEPMFQKELIKRLSK